MESTSRRLLLSFGVLALVVSLCLSLISISGAGLFFWTQAAPQTCPVPIIITPVQKWYPTPTKSITEVPTDTPISATETPVESSANPTGSQVTPVPGTSSIPPELAAQLDEIETQTIQLRELQPTNQTARELVSPAGLRQLIIDDFLQSYSVEDAHNEALVLTTLGLIEPAFDLYIFYIALYSEQTAGFYDFGSKEMYVVETEEFLGPERITYAHEYVHLLQDQQFAIEDDLNYNDDVCDPYSEHCKAIQALIEGDAILLEIDWYSTFATQTDIDEIQTFVNEHVSPVYDQAPEFFKEDLMFPGAKGSAFVEYLLTNGGWQAVNQAYLDPPVSTEQILHPERYPSEIPIPVTIPDLTSILGSSWREVDRGMLGEWFTYLVLSFGSNPITRINPQQAQIAADGWGGDLYTVYHNGQTGETLMVLTTIWDTPEEASQFGATFRQYASARFGLPREDIPGLLTWDSSEQHVEFFTDGSYTSWVIAPNADVAQSIQGLLLQP